MPEIKLQHVVSASSEDKNYPAENLLITDGFKKWKSKGTGEKQVTVTIQLEKACQIKQIDIGNESSAFVEVLVGRSSTKGEDFQVILVASSFMSPTESRNNENATRVRIFGEDQLSKAVIDQNWDMVKVVCTQPFNKNIQYGLSFMKLHSPGGCTEKQRTLGVFAMKAPEVESIKPGSLFAMRDKEKPSTVPCRGAAAARAASRLAEEPTNKSATGDTATKRRHSDERSEKPGPSHTEAVSRPLLQKQSTSISSTSSASSHKEKPSQPPLKKMKSEPPKHSKEKEFQQLLSKVTFVLSGFQNPERGQLRDKAMEMGAKYKGDWAKGCTHLVCAFENTPKYNQVKGKGKIVTKNWIRECYKAKKLLPWRQFRLGKAKSPPPSSDDDENTDNETSPIMKETPVMKQATAAAPNSDSDEYEGSTDGGDTDDEIRRATALSPRPPSKVPAAGIDDIYDASTDEETGGVNGADTSGVDKDGLPRLADLFTGKHFFFYGSYSPAQRRAINRLIIAYNGRVEEYMGEKINFVVTESDWDKNFDGALGDNPALIFVKSDWIYACDHKQQLVPHQKYEIVPK